MMRSKPSSSMQKTYDDCYLICSTAVYFEGQNNEPEALRSWRDALDAIYYHNAYKIPSGWRPKTETDKALHESLRQMEVRCKERVDLLEALRESREEAKKGSVLDVNKAGLTQVSSNTSASAAPTAKPSGIDITMDPPTPGWLGDGTIPPANYSSIPRPNAVPTLPPRTSLPARPNFTSRNSSGLDGGRSKSSPKPAATSAFLTPSDTLAPTRPDNTRKSSRTPSPEKKSMLRTLRSGNRKDSGRLPSSLRSRPPAASSKAASQAWGSTGYGSSELSLAPSNGDGRTSGQHKTLTAPVPTDSKKRKDDSHKAASYRGRTSSDINSGPSGRSSLDQPGRPQQLRHQSSTGSVGSNDSWSQDDDSEGPPVPAHGGSLNSVKPAISMPTYRQEYPPAQPSKYAKPPLATPPRQWDQPTSSGIASSTSPPQPRISSTAHSVPRKAIGVLSATQQRQQLDSDTGDQPRSVHTQAATNSSTRPRKARPPKPPKPTIDTIRPSTSSSDDSPLAKMSLSPDQPWETRKEAILAHLPANIDKTAATQILNEVALSSQPVHWTDISGLGAAKAALKENVIYPFLRPDLFRGLRSPANGILLFGPPGTGKTMLARAVATESRSTFFAIGAGSLTSKFLGESEKLVRALFACARLAGPSIVFVDEIESLMGRRGEGAHDAVERVKTEFLVGWGELQAAVAAESRREHAGPHGTSDQQQQQQQQLGDASRVLVLAATNLPWLIDEAARRRFVRRQYIPLPEAQTRREQLVKLLERQRHALRDRELDELVRLTDGFSGSDITSLAKDAAMGPLRALGERLLDMSPEDIRPISVDDFRASLVNIRPSVGKAGLRAFEEWAAEFGERGG